MNTGARVAASELKSKGCNVSYGDERVMRTACNDDDVSNRTFITAIQSFFALNRVVPASTCSTLGPFAIDDAQGQELVQWAFALDGCTSDAETGGC